MMINYEIGKQTTVPMHRKDLSKGTETRDFKTSGTIKVVSP
ncbi:MAG: hypothetical protein ACLSEA_04990 [Thomasclavelia ramosa]